MGDSLEDQLKYKLEISKQDNIKLEQHNAELKKKVNRLEEEVQAYKEKETPQNIETKARPAEEITVKNKEVLYEMARSWSYPARAFLHGIIDYQITTGTLVLDSKSRKSMLYKIKKYLIPEFIGRKAEFKKSYLLSLSPILAGVIQGCIFESIAGLSSYLYLFTDKKFLPSKEAAYCCMAFMGIKAATNVAAGAYAIFRRYKNKLIEKKKQGKT